VLCRLIATPGRTLRLPPAFRENHLIITVHAAAMGENGHFDEVEYTTVGSGDHNDFPAQRDFAPRFSRTLTLIRIGLPSNPNVSRSRRSRNRRKPASKNPVVNSTNVGGRAVA
jgi:hypothetical protein